MAFTFHYASTLSCDRSCTSRRWSSFTFHYASTLSSGGDKDWPSAALIYIPLCFYFIRLARWVPGRKLQIYIPLCFYFIPLDAFRLRLLITFTFHYASTLSVGFGFFWSSVSYLHSTMLLLYPGRCGRYCVCCVIYIPLCFYFIIRRMECITIIVLIYIPLCFYFICIPGNGKPDDYTFTFHYASTLSSALNDSRLPPSKFTFHYASTLSDRALSSAYIAKTFTFHYASTLSEEPERVGRSVLHLHSTMLLLYP